MIIVDVDKTRRGKRRSNQLAVAKLMGVPGGAEYGYIHRRYRDVIERRVLNMNLTDKMIAGEVYRYLKHKARSIEEERNQKIAVGA